ncbi:UrcA family protein [Phenylobacterium sp.]|jgi:UrcA family protein|uniref:UrcA family protein n=1 Tax=Phenylobacterium sp. TaxID=1871053 RepID=UPI002E33FFFE|nr:UrcA family protein [Phenylobacterium sp.]HEX2560382.1 UrcA family protein [Phenylobacterium sp.]
MTNYVNKIAGIAAIALAALPLVAIAGVAEAASVKIGDIDPSTVEGQLEFQSRVKDAANDYCRANALTGSRLASHRTCVAAVHDEMNEKLVKVQQAKAEKAQAYAAR